MVRGSGFRVRVSRESTEARTQNPELQSRNPDPVRRFAMTFVNGLKCRECGREYPKQPIAGCEDCFGPLEVDYDYEAISRALSREVIAPRSKNLWRYRELLP